jgi:dihydroxyacetone kinase
MNAITGVAGTVLIHKLVGAMAEAGISLKQIAQDARVLASKNNLTLFLTFLLCCMSCVLSFSQPL